MFKEKMKNLLALIFGESLKKRLMGRECKPLRVLHEEFTRSYEIDFEEWKVLWLQVSKLLEVESGKLRVEDRFAVDLAPKEGLFGFGLDESLVDLSEYIENITSFQINLIEDDTIVTVGDLLKAVLSLPPQKKTKN